ncbi:hypothetical protein [Neorhizobium sp. T25_13]|uniref:hypothetical protein n=1 Tax=Neorhizobium sp. T25_13 TaxID=2093830 RepID=UPI00155ECDC7|nr:hypothetical protein [Neorhizobium sp. T25_13]
MRTTNRDDFSAAVRRVAAQRVAYRCSSPACDRVTVGPDSALVGAAVSIGKAAHIHAASPGGPRFDAAQTPAERASLANALWLCSNCATMIDVNGGASFPAKKLKQWRVEAEARASKELQTGQAELQIPAFLRNYIYINYINTPRLQFFVKDSEKHSPVFAETRNGFPKGSMIWHLSQLGDIVSSLHIGAIELSDLFPLSEDFIGSIVSVNEMFYTKNGVVPGREDHSDIVESFDLKKSPHIYLKLDGFKVISPYDPRWVTTSTAFSAFRGGRQRFAGLFILKSIDFDEHQLLLSPLVMGLPIPPGMEGFYKRSFA